MELLVRGNPASDSEEESGRGCYHPTRNGVILVFSSLAHEFWYFFGKKYYK
jgi:hypothetical protein